jgi:hypothetical protein
LITNNLFSSISSWFFSLPSLLRGSV